jgi:hypothetical protein
MTRTALVLLAWSLLLGLVSCTRSASAPPANQLATDVAATLTAAPSLPPSNTPPPSATALSTVTATVPPTATATLTGTLGPSPTPIPPELLPGDPRTGLNLAAPDYTDDFSLRFKWFAGFSDPGVEIRQQDDTLIVIDRRADTYLTWSTSDAKGGNVYAEVSAKVEACQGRDAYGMALRVGGGNYDRGYALEFSCDGQYRIRKFFNVDTPVKILVDWTPAEAIAKGPGAANRIGFLAKGTRLYAFANRTFLGEAEDPDYPAGVFALFANANETDGVQATFDDFALWYPED